MQAVIAAYAAIFSHFQVIAEAVTLQATNQQWVTVRKAHELLQHAGTAVQIAIRHPEADLSTHLWHLKRVEAEMQQLRAEVAYAVVERQG